MFYKLPNMWNKEVFGRQLLFVSLFFVLLTLVLDICFLYGFFSINLSLISKIYWFFLKVIVLTPLIYIILLQKHITTEQEDFYKSLLKHINTPIFIIDKNGHIIDVNISATNLLEYGTEDIINMHFGHLLPSSEYHKNFKAFIDAFKGVSESYKTIILNKNGDLLHVEILVAPIIVSNLIISAVCILQNINKEYS